MIRLVLALLLSITWLPLATAEEAPAGAEPAASSESAMDGPASDAPKDEAWGDGKVARGPRPTKEPAKGSPYNWVQMGYAAGLMLLMLGFVLWLIRRNSRARDDADKG